MVFEGSPLTYSIFSAFVLLVGLTAAWGLRRLPSVKRFSIPFAILIVALSGRLLSKGYLPILGERFAQVWEKLLIVGAFWLAIEAIKWLLTHLVMDRILRLSVEEITKNIISAGLYIAAILILLPTVFGIKVATVLTTSAILTVIVGLALQDLLGNLFAGVALNIEMPFSKDDWVQIGEDIGVIREISWRTTKIMTSERDLVIIPNSVVSKLVVKNFSVPTRRDILTLSMGVAYDAPPNLVCGILREACDRAQGVQKHPEPLVRVTGYGDFAVNYEMRVWIEEYPRHKDVRNEIYSLIWYLFRRHNINIPYPVRDLHIKTASRKEEMERKALFERQRAKQLRKVGLFSSLADEDIDLLASQAPAMRYSRGETIVRQGEAGDSFFLIGTGKVRIFVEKEAGEEVAIATLGPGDYFGGMSLLTGEPRNATAVAEVDTELLVIDKELFNEILVAKPQIAEHLGKQLVERQLDREAKIAESEKVAAPKPTREQKRQLHDRLLRRIKEFFQIQ